MDFKKRCEVGAALLGAEWRFAKTAAKTNPHWYTLRKTWGDSAFVRAGLAVREFGYPLKWRDQRVYTCYDINDMRYWSMGFPLRAAEEATRLDDWKNETILINKTHHKKMGTYDSIAGVYDEVFSSPEWKDEDRRVADSIGVLEGSVLDVGCGTGLVYDCCNIDKSQYHGIDPSEVMLKEFRNKHGEASLTCSTYENFYSINKYDNIVSTYGSVNYIPLNFFAKMRYQLKEGGRFFLMFYADDYTPNGYSMFGKEMEHHRGGEKLFSGCTRLGNYTIASGAYEDLPA